MSPREVQDPTKDKYGDDTHPAFGAIHASRTSWSGGGAVLFDSDIRHQHTVVVTLSRMTRKRDLSHDWLHPTRELFEVEMSEAQWASFVSSMNSGGGVPCTIRSTENEHNVPGLPYAPRLAHSMAEARGAADAAFARIQSAMAAVDALDSKAPAKERRAAMDELRNAIRHSTSGVDFASQSLVEHTENVVQRARADIEAMVTSHAARLGLTAAQTPTLALEASDD